MKKIILLHSILILLIINVGADDLVIKSVGNPFVTNYSYSEYKAEKQNWDITIGRNGLIYFANGPLLEAGTNYWNRYYLPGGNRLRSVCSLDDNSIMVGGNVEIGVFKPGELPGTLKYKSLMDRLDSSFHSFGTVWQIFPDSNYILIRAGRALFKYEKDTITPIIFGRIVDYAKVVNNTIIVRIVNEGLGYLNNGNFELFPFGQDFSLTKVVSVEAIGENDYLIFTDDKGVFITDKKTIQPYSILNDKNLIESQIFRVIFLQNKYFVIGTVKDGLFIYDLKGKLIQHLNRENGLQNNTVISLQADSSNNLWLGLDNGISYVELNSCISNLNSENDIGTGYVSKYLNGKLYFGTNQGLFYTEWDSANPDKNVNKTIYSVKNTSGQVWSLFSQGDILYCGHHKGLLRIDNNSGVLVNEVDGCWQIDSLLCAPGYFLESTYRGYYLLKLNKKGSLISSKKLDYIPLNKSIYFLEDRNGFIWIKTFKNEIFRFTIDPNSLNVKELVEMTSYKGLPSFSRVNIVGNKNLVYISISDGIYSFNYAKDLFENNAFYDQIIGKGEVCREFFEDNYSRTWYVNNKEIGYFSMNHGKAEKVNLPFNRIVSIYKNSNARITVIDKEDVLFGVDQGFFHYKCLCNNISEKDYHTYIVNIVTPSTATKWYKSDSFQPKIPVYKNKKNAIEFTFTSDFFESPHGVYYQYQLVGFDDDWSEWSQKNSKEYNNLFEGRYQIKVRARNGFGNESETASFSFMISPPFYRTIAAYLFYLVLLFIIVIILRKIRMNRIEFEKRKILAKKQLEIEQKKKKYEEEQLIAKQKISELEKERLQQDLLHKTKELSNSMLNILHKNEIFLGLKDEMQKLYLEKNLPKRDTSIRKLIQAIDNEVSSKRDLEIFDSNFTAVHEDFIRKLKEEYPELNQNDQRLCTFLKMNKTTKEIASLMNMSTRGVETSRYRLRKKMGLDREANLYDIILEI
ncbi:MAG: hypothetical protein K9H49_05170 [Bacteroidales bacterium]|nr:hypothetical protein [Bacteroidales bacterium]MCF8389884.1 hypothetical protein [Bacteroidales bacterium]